MCQSSTLWTGSFTNSFPCVHRNSSNSSKPRHCTKKVGFDRDKDVSDSPMWGAMFGSVSHGLLASSHVCDRSGGVCMRTVAFTYSTSTYQHCWYLLLLDVKLNVVSRRV